MEATTQEREMLTTTDTNKIRVARCISRQIDSGMTTEDAIRDAQEHLDISRDAVIECLRFAKNYISDFSVTWSR